MSNHPAERDLRSYKWGTTLCALGLILCVFGLGFALKAERKAAFPKPIMWGNCYVMSDNIVTCP